MKYKHFSIEEREIIQYGLWHKKSIRSIARELNRSVSSISREINRNTPPVIIKYTPRVAHERALNKRKSRGRKERLKNEKVRHYVIEHLKIGWSPEQISGRIDIDLKETISHEAIYQYIYSQIYRNGYGYVKPECEDLRACLKRRHRRRIPKGARRCQRVLKTNGIPIDLRPEIVDKRIRIGDWESDSIESGKQSVVGLNTLNERKTGLVFITKIKNRTPKETSETIVSRLSCVPHSYLKTITFDNGIENQDWKSIRSSINIECFFAHPYSSFERETNENTNGLIRWYFPKKTNFANISDEDISNVEYLLNTRPRKRLGWKTPLEVFNTKCCTSRLNVPQKDLTRLLNRYIITLDLGYLK